MGAFRGLLEMMVGQALVEEHLHLVYGFTLDLEQAELEAQQLEEEQVVQLLQDRYFLARRAVLDQQHFLLAEAAEMALRPVVALEEAG